MMAGCTDFQPDISLYPTNMQSFSSVPLGSLVDTKLKSKIWANQFIELELRVGDSTAQPIIMLQPATNNTYVEVKQQVTKKIVNIDQWSDAFLIFIAIHTEHCPSDTQDILKYMQIIRTMAANSRTPAFLAYDKDFRKLVRTIQCRGVSSIKSCFFQ